MPLYVDSSAFVKLLVREAESDALRAYLASTRLLTSAITRIEVERSVRRNESHREISVGDFFDGVEIRLLDDSVVAQASTLEPALGVVDAIHLASALDLRAELEGFVTYHARLADAARAHRLPVVSPA